jgi:hypothetical protein
VAWGYALTVLLVVMVPYLVLLNDGRIRGGRSIRGTAATGVGGW